MATKQSRSILSLVAFVVLAVVISSFDSIGPFALIGTGLVFVWLVRRLAAAKAPTAAPDPGDVPPEVVARLSRLAGEAIVPGGRSNEELARDLEQLHPELPPEVRQRIDAAGPLESGWNVEVSGPLAARVSQWTGVPVATGDGIVAPDVLTGGEVTPPGSVLEGWYRTADGSRERWHNGAGWTAHERSPGQA